MRNVGKAEHDITPNFPIVGIGASAGGLKAFEYFFSACPADTGMSFVLVSHLDPNHESLLTEILQHKTTMPIAEALDRLEVRPNCVYVIPPNSELEIFQGILQLIPPILPHGQRKPIDIFFQSLADDQRGNAIGIIFSGTGNDGTSGMRAIFLAGGTTMVQEPSTAQYNGMPTSVIEAVRVDKILAVEEMPKALLGIKYNINRAD